MGLKRFQTIKRYIHIVSSFNADLNVDLYEPSIEEEEQTVGDQYLKNI